jgi:hypothetical protein
MRKVIIETPFTKDVNNTELCRQYYEYFCECLFDSLDRGEAPVNLHFLYNLVLDSVDLKTARTRMQATHRWIAQASCLVVYTDLGMLPEMAISTKFARDHSIPVKYRLLHK